jgi:peptidyl-prolyl cis-trans isomerase D
MLQNFRDNLNGAAKVILVAIIIVPFALFGVDALFVGGDSIQEAANVNGEPISERTLQQAVLVQKQQIINRFKEVDPALIDEEKLRPAVMQRLIRQKVEEQAAIDLGMGLSKSTVYDLLAQIPEFQTDGKFDAQRYDFVVRQMGYTPTTHNKAIRSELLVNQFLQGVVATGFTTEKELELLASMVEQTRDYYYLTIPAEPLKKTLEVSADEVEAYYKSNSAQFMTEEKLVVEYIELQPSDLLSEISVDDELVDERYEEKVQELSQTAARHSAHILLEKQDEDSHLKKMAVIKEKINNGEDFAVLAKEYSEDYATSEQGGDLGYTQPGDLPEALEVALENLSVGEVSAIVETKAGVHLIKLIDKKTPNIPSRDELEPSIREELALQIAQERLPERIEALKDLSYNATSLQDTADQMALDLKVSEPFTRAGGVGIAANTLVVNAAYSDSVLVDGYASDVIELSDNRVLVLAIRERMEPRLKALDEVKDQIEHVMKAQKASEQLLARGEELQKRVKSGRSIEDVAKEEGLAWQVSLNTKRLRRDQGDPIRRQVFSLPLPDKEPVVDYLLLPNGDYVLVSLVKVEDGDYSALSLEQKQALFASRSMATAGRDYQAYGSLLLGDAEVVSKY